MSLAFTFGVAVGALIVVIALAVLVVRWMDALDSERWW